MNLILSFTITKDKHPVKVVESFLFDQGKSDEFLPNIKSNNYAKFQFNLHLTTTYGSKGISFHQDTFHITGNMVGLIFTANLGSI